MNVRVLGIIPVSVCLLYRCIMDEISFSRIA